MRAGVFSERRHSSCSSFSWKQHKPQLMISRSFIKCPILNNKDNFIFVFIEMSQFSNFWSEIMEYDWIFHCFINSSPRSAAYMHQWFGSVLVQIMACYLFVAKPLFKPILGYCQLNHEKQTSVKFWSKYKSFHSSENSCIWKYCPRNGSHFCPGGDELIWKY